MTVRYLPENAVPGPPPLRVTVQDRVSVPDGRVGSVIGFYMRDPATVLVALEPGDVREFSPADLRRVGG